MQSELFIQMGIMGWESGVKRATATFKNLPEATFYEEIAPGRNRPVYVLGHLVAVHDLLLPLLGLGERLYPELDAAFIRTPDKTVADIPSVPALLEKFDTVNALLSKKFSELSTAEWLQRHTQVSEEDFAKEPHRNRYNVLLGRTNHLSYHLGQIVLVKK